MFVRSEFRSRLLSSCFLGRLANISRLLKTFEIEPARLSLLALILSDNYSCIKSEQKIFDFVLFCFCFCFVLFCFVLFCFALLCFALLCFVLFCFVFVSFRFVLFCWALKISLCSAAAAPGIKAKSRPQIDQLDCAFGQNECLPYSKTNHFCICRLGRIYRIAFLSVINKVRSDEKSRSYDDKVIRENVTFFKSQLGLPDKDCKEFEEMSAKLQDEVQEFDKIDEMDVGDWMRMFAAQDASSPVDNAEIEDLEKKLANFCKVKGSAKPFWFVYYSLSLVLHKMSVVATKVLKEKMDQQLSFKYD